MVELNEVKTQVHFLASCYPQIQWDGAMTAGAWFTMLNNINATNAELQRTCNYIVKKGYSSHEVNISLIISLILEERKSAREKIEGQNEIKRINESEKASPEKIDEFMKQIREEWNKNGNQERN